MAKKAASRRQSSARKPLEAKQKDQGSPAEAAPAAAETRPEVPVVPGPVEPAAPEGILDPDKPEGVKWAYKCVADKCGKAALYSVQKADDNFVVDPADVPGLKCQACGEEPVKLISGKFEPELWYKVR